MTDFLLELRSEEIPARMQAGARADLEKLFRKELAAAGIEPGAITVWSTPRRLALIARDLPEATQAVREETKGPAVGAPAQALEGFLRKAGLTQDQLEVRDLKGKQTYFAVVEKPGRSVAAVLAEAIPAIVRAFPWPKSMRWGAASISTESPRWVRPLSGIVAIFGEELVPCTAGSVESGYATLGHRFHHPGVITIGGAHDYADKLRACQVIVDHEERQAIVRDGARAAAEAAGLTLVEDEGLVVENAGLTEWPVPLLGRFDEAFLEVPPEVIQLTARVNQKYFVCEKDGRLANAFVCTANIEARDGGEAIVAGNRKVLAARLSDARFFWDTDRKTRLAEQAKKLQRITFHEKLGTVADKVERVAALAEWLASEGIVPDCDPALARQAAELCKADLVTEMVGEFPELQGLMGGYYARAEGLPDAVADAIRDHYKPVGQGDEVPSAPVTVAVSLADKLDTLGAFFAVDLKPTGSKDPFALRRAILAAIATSVEVGIRAQWRKLLTRVVENLGSVHGDALLIDGAVDRVAKAEQDRGPHALWQAFDKTFPGVIPQGEFPPIDPNAELSEITEASVSKTVDALMEFLIDRLKVQQREAGVRHDLIDAVFALGGEDDLVRLLARVHALQAFVGTEDGANLLAGYKRAANILKKEGWDNGKSQVWFNQYEPEKEERELDSVLDRLEPEVRDAVKAEAFESAMTLLASLRAPVDAFFEKVTVNDPDPRRRETRLALLARVRNIMHRLGDFSRIEG